MNSSSFALTDEVQLFRLHDQKLAFPKGANREVGVWSAFWRPIPSLDVTIPVFVPLVAGVTERDVRPHLDADRVERAAANIGRGAAGLSVDAPHT
ncbi:hypothetical protein AWB81_07622 [Caballeronia arationis]|uniref:hypothetical protein n=1 Tax=Caballeronia arationis TaxID=1777142 RepID=UPI00074BD5BA|nr:hypothetical protein [Caballeronia arationis]SAL06499.1 hypothetical protein AWB81_07622 [Caballeronia arationis]